MTETINGHPILGPKQFDPENPQPGIYRDIPNEVYHSSNAISASLIIKASKSISHYMMEQERTKAMKLGTAIHAAVLEPEEFKKNYRIQPALDMKSNEGASEAVKWLGDMLGVKYAIAVREESGKEGLKNLVKKLAKISGATLPMDFESQTIFQLEKVEKTMMERAREDGKTILTKRTELAGFYYNELLPLAESKGFSIITGNEKENVSEMHRSVWTHPIAKRVFVGGYAELSFFGRLPDELGGGMCRIRPDYYKPKQKTLVSFKSTNCAEDYAIQKKIYEMGYYISEAFYNWVFSRCFGIELNHHLMVFTESVAPYITEVKRIGETSLAVGEFMFTETINKTVEFASSPNPYAGYSSGKEIEIVDMPMWALNKFNDKYSPA